VFAAFIAPAAYKTLAGRAKGKSPAPFGVAAGWKPAITIQVATVSLSLSPLLSCIPGVTYLPPYMRPLVAKQRPDLHRTVVLVVLATTLAFPLALSAAIACYPGRIESAHGYRFWNDFLSALGETRTPAGHDNFRACLIFNIALAMAMLAVIPYWHIRSDCLRGPKVLRWLTFLCCTGFSLGIVGVATTPYNLHPHLHNGCVYTAFAVIVPGILLLVLGSDPLLVGRPYRVVWAVFATALLVTEWLLGRLVSYHVLPYDPVQPTLQKINAAVFFAWLLADVWLFNAYLNRREAEPPHRSAVFRLQQREP
jgi:hypothetical protein